MLMHGLHLDVSCRGGEWKIVAPAFGVVVAETMMEAFRKFVIVFDSKQDEIAESWLLGQFNLDGDNDVVTSLPCTDVDMSAANRLCDKGKVIISRSCVILMPPLINQASLMTILGSKFGIQTILDGFSLNVDILSAGSGIAFMQNGDYIYDLEKVIEIKGKNGEAVSFKLAEVVCL